MAKLWEKQAKIEAFRKRNTWPESPGVYFFLDGDKGILYIGKATALRDRVRSYFASDIAETRGPKIVQMLARARFIAYRRTDSVLEALILESRLIKEHQPPHNTDAKDDKSYNHVVLTAERYPRVLLVRGHDIDQGKLPAAVKDDFGPFPSGGGLKEALRIVRRLFPYRDKCVPCAELPETGRAKARPCFSAQVGLCPGVCEGRVTAREYARTIRHIRLFFQGKKGALLRQLTREMRAAARALRFEEAGAIKRTLFALQHIQDMALVKDDRREATKHRLEAYDVAHLGGRSAVGVMTVVQNGKAAPSQYRQFRLRGEHHGNDLTALEEVLRRRFGHPEWPFPELLVVDGSEPQVAVAGKVLHEAGLAIPVLGVVKDARHRPTRIAGVEALAKRFKKEILLANAEAHRFAIAFHRLRRAGSFLPV